MGKTILNYRFARDVVKEAYNLVVSERKGEQLGLYCDLPVLNIAMGKFFRFANVNLWAGLSGHGKSYFLNQLNRAFVSNVNIGFKRRVIIIQFCFEMSATDEILRACAADLGISYSYLLSSQYDKDTKNYNTLSDEYLIKVKTALDYYSTKNIIFVDNPGNVHLIYNTVEDIYNKAKAKFPNEDIALIVNIDHTLLIEKLDESDLLELMLNTGKLSIVLRKNFKAMINLIGQLNNNIEDVRRLTNPALHYPQKSDIYAQGQIYNACDNVFVIHQPQLLKLETYGTKKYPTKDLIHLSKLKSRHGKVGNIWLKDDLINGRIIPFDLSKSDSNELENEQDDNSLTFLPKLK
jgi:replicative DNA helicase